MAGKKTLQFIAFIGATSAIACAPLRARPAPTPTPLPLAPPTTSCATTPARDAVKARDVDWVGHAGDRTWIVAKNGAHRALLRLVKGKLEAVQLPPAFDDGFVSAHARDHFLWILRTGPGKTISSPAWVLVDVRDAAQPRVGPMELLEPLPADAPNRFALWADRALFFLGSPGELVTWDLEKATALGSRVRPDGKAGETPWLHCQASGCIAIMAEGEEAKRRLVVRGMDRDGNDGREEMGPGVVAEAMSFFAGKRIFSAWSRFDARGLWARKVDPETGKLDGDAYTVAGVDQDLQDPQAIASRQGTLLAWQAARIGWRLGKLKEDGTGVTDVMTLPAKGAFLSAATTDDGIVAAIYSTGQDEERDGKEWYSSVRALFVPFGKTPKEADVSTLVNEEHGKGNGGFVGYALAAPDSAAVLVAPRGDAQEKAFLQIFRTPCGSK